MREFSGFSSDTIDFLADLSANNNKAWFDDNRARYQDCYVKPAVDFVSALEKPLHKLDPALHTEARINGSIFRINRDIRFSKDKTPYKDHLDLWFWEGDRKKAISGLFFRLTKNRLIIGAGAHRFSPEQISSFRAILSGGGIKAQSLLQIQDDLHAIGVTLSGEHYKSIPRGMEVGEERIATLARFNALFCAEEAGHPASIGTSIFLDYCIDRWRTFIPLHKWLVRM